jgi:hypothetical protein
MGYLMVKENILMPIKINMRVSLKMERNKVLATVGIKTEVFTKDSIVTIFLMARVFFSGVKGKNMMANGKMVFFTDKA